MPNSAVKTFHFEPQSDYALIVIFDSWLHLTALIGASTSILEAGGFDVSEAKQAITRGDAALVAVLRRDRVEERLT